MGKQQRAYFKQTGAEKPIMDILKESAAKQFKPLFRGTIPLMGHSLASATTGLVGQPKLQKYIQKELGQHTSFGSFACNMVSSACVSPIYVAMTNPLSRLEVARDTRENGLRGMFRGQGIGIAKAIVSLSMFHQGRIWCMDYAKARNKRLGYCE